MKKFVAIITLTLFFVVGTVAPAQAARLSGQELADYNRAVSFNKTCMEPFDNIYHAKKRNVWGKAVYKYGVKDRVQARNLGEFICSSATIDYSQGLKSKHSASMLQYVLIMEKLRKDNAKHTISAVSNGVAKTVIDNIKTVYGWSKVSKLIENKRFISAKSKLSKTLKPHILIELLQPR